jgi:thiamine kinase-like enzyme
VAAYRKKFVPNYQEMILQKYGKKAQTNPDELEDEILKEIREAEASGEEFTKEEQRKINMLHAHRTILKEYWENYRVVKPTKDEGAKSKYLEGLIRVLAAIKELEQSEKSFLSAMDSIRKAENLMTLEKYLDSIRAWWVPRCMEKAPSKEQALLAIDSLKTFLDEYKQVVVNSANCAAANLVVLEKLYVSQKLKIEEKEE